MSTQILPATRPEVVSYDPATGKEIGRVTLTAPSEVSAAVKRARLAQPNWATLSFKERARLILKTRELLLAEMDEVAKLISRETGKPVSEALAMEVVPTLDAMHYFAKNAERLLRPQKIDIGQYGLMGRSSRIVYRPLGVIGIISPWNFPLGTPMEEVAMAMMAGNTVVLKPSELTSLVGVRIGELFTRAGLPQNVLQVVTGDGSTGAALVDAAVDKLMFTGSVETGKRVAAAAARHLTPVVLELGGKDPMVVFADADLENAARAAVWGAFANAGQACASVERCYVQKEVAAKFIDLVLTETKSLKQGMTEESDIGAISNQEQLETIDRHVEEAVAQGASILIGGQREKDAAGLFYPPTVLTKVDHSMEVMREETFGPVLPIMVFNDEPEALHLANDSVFGLTASVWTRDISKGRRVAKQIEAGTVMVNEVLYTHGIAQTPWGGVKQSGYGRTHGRLGLLELVIPQHIHVNRITFLPDIWWFHYDAAARRLFAGLARYFTTGSILRTSRLFPQMLKRMLRK
jgi:succinate-semialdehyde dehydrogenase/glutarate-semialdehyde dehydrogenase